MGTATELYDIIAHSFPVAFDVASAAVHKQLFYLSKGQSIPVETAPGLTVIRLPLRPDVLVCLTIQKRAEQVTSLELAVIVPADPIQQAAYRNRDTLIHEMHTVYRVLSGAIVESIRFTHPGYGRDYIEHVTPPPPRGDWTAFNLWREIHTPDATSRELAELMHCEPQTIDNERAKYRKRLEALALPKPQRPKRGRPRKNTE